jgi:dTDP-4-amino-4,6-dideoxygalactose transaminase
VIVPFVDLVAQYESIKSEIDEAFYEVTASAEYILGSRVERFEKDFAGYVGVSHAVGVGSGLDALRLALLALGIGRGDEVVVPANSYIATALAVSEVGAAVTLVDCDPSTYNIDIDQIEAVVTDRTAAIIPVHLTGQAAEMDSIRTIAERDGLRIVEDAAQAHGAHYNGHVCGSLGDVGCFSFYPGKNLGAYGDAGLVTTNDPAVAEHLRRLRNYGERRKYEHVIKAVNSRLDTLQAAFLSVKLQHLNHWNEARSRHAEAYCAALDGVGDLAFQQRLPNATHVYHLFIVETAQRDQLREHLAASGVQTGLHYPTPIHLQEAYADLGLPPGSFPEAERLAARTLSLPMFPELRPDQLEYVAEQIGAFFANLRSCRT